jgi:cellulose biosynthesis protein BcsQ
MNIREQAAQGIIYTFYSYKGGVGRSMAAANAAVLLAKWGHSVLVVDWDREAPGLERFFARSASDATRIGKSKPGIVDLITAFSRSRKVRHSETHQSDWKYKGARP